MYQLNLDGQMTGCIVSIGIAIRCISSTPPLLSFGGLFHVEQMFCRKRKMHMFHVEHFAEKAF